MIWTWCSCWEIENLLPAVITTISVWPLFLESAGEVMLFSVPINDSGLVTEKQLGSLPGHHTRKSLYCLMAKQSLQSVSNHPHWSSLPSNQRPRFPFYFSSHLPHMPGPRCCKHSYMCRHFEIKIFLLQDLKAQSLIERFWWIFCWKKSQENRLVISQQSFFSISLPDSQILPLQKTTTSIKASCT